MTQWLNYTIHNWLTTWPKWLNYTIHNWAPSSEFVSSSIPSWQILTAHAQPFRGARDLVFCLKVPLDSLFVWASTGGSGETARMRRLAWTFAARIGDKYQTRLARPNWLTCFKLFHLARLVSAPKPVVSWNSFLCMQLMLTRKFYSFSLLPLDPWWRKGHHQQKRHPHPGMDFQMTYLVCIDTSAWKRNRTNIFELAWQKWVM